MCLAERSKLVTPCLSNIIAADERSGLDSYMQTERICEIGKDGLDVMSFWAWRETPGLRRERKMAGKIVVLLD